MFHLAFQRNKIHHDNASDMIWGGPKVRTSNSYIMNVDIGQAWDSYVEVSGEVSSTSWFIFAFTVAKQYPAI